MTSEDSQPFTVRLPLDLHEVLKWLARVNGTSMNEEVVLAIRAAVDARRKDPAFRKRLAESMERNKGILEKLRRR